jgi:DNA-binding protein HU-beta
MNKKELIDAIVAKLNADKKVVGDVLDAMESIVMDELKADRQVNLTGFGIFHTAIRKGRAGVNPRTKQPIQIPSVRVPKFRPGKTLKEAVR